LPLVASQTYKRGELLNLKIPFEVNGSVPSAIAWCNVSVNYPNGTYLVENYSMTNRGSGDFNISLSGTQLNKVGDYNWTAFCCDGGLCAAGYGEFKITPSGQETITSGESLTLIFSIGLIVILAILFFIFSFKVVSFPAKVIFMGLSLVFFVIVLLFSMLTIGQTLGGYDSLVNSYSSFFWVALFLFFLVFLFLMLVLMKKTIEVFKMQRGFA